MHQIETTFASLSGTTRHVGVELPLSSSLEHSRQMPAAFFDLPLELKLMIKGALEPWDLRGIVSLYLADPRLCAALYDGEDESGEFWELACWKNGIGRLPDDMEIDGDMWFKIALECVGLDGFCKHPYCGERLAQDQRARLAGECMRECEEHIERFSAVRVTQAYRADVSFAPSPVLYHIDFRPARERMLYEQHGVEHDAHLRVAGRSQALDPQGTEDGASRAYLGQHPIAARSFATATPASNIFLLDIVGWSMSSDPTLTLRRPVTVLDVLRLMHRDLDKRMTVRDVYEHVEGHVECIEKKGWGVKDAFGNLQTIRGILELCPIIFMEIAEYTDDGPAVSFSLC